MLFKILYFLFSFLYIITTYWGFSVNSIIPGNDTISDKEWYEWLLWFFEFFKDTIFSLMMVVALGSLLFIWARMIIARGKPEEFKKAVLSFIYTIVWIVVITFSWAIIKFASGVNF